MSFVIAARLNPLSIFALTVLFAVLVSTSCLLVGCSPLEQQAYQTVVAANAFLKSMKAQHPECQQASSTICSKLIQATGAKDSLIDAAEVYCAGPDFNGGGKCNPPRKGTAAAAQAEAKLREAISSYDQIEADLRSATGKR